MELPDGVSSCVLSGEIKVCTDIVLTLCMFMNSQVPEFTVSNTLNGRHQRSS